LICYFILRYKLVPATGNAQKNGWKPRVMKSPNCGFTHDRDVIGAINIDRKYLIDGSPVPLGSTAAHEPIGIAKSLWARWNSLDANMNT